MKTNLLTKMLLVAVLLGVGASNAWAATETLSGADDTSINNGIFKTSFTMLGAYNPSGKTDINEKSCLKVRWQVSNASTGNTNGFALKVNTGYKITGVTAQMSGNGGTVTLKDIKVDGTSYSGEYSKTLNASNAAEGDKYTNITLSDINAQNYINFEIADGSAKTQGYVYITVTYEEVKDVIYTKSLSGWTSSDVTKTEVTLDKWYNSTGIVANDYSTGMMIDATYGLRLAARNTTATAALKNSHTANSIVTIDAVWNVGSASSNGNTPNNKFQFGDLMIQQNVRSDNLTTTYKINGTTKNVGTDKFARQDDMTIHLKVNSYNGNILEFSIKNGETEVASFSELTSTTNHFAAGSKYDEVTMTSWISASSSYAWCALKSITISEQEQAVYSYTVKGKTGGTTLKTLATGDNLPGSTIYYHYNQVLNNNGTLYKAAADNNAYKSSFTLESDNQEVVKAYSQPATPITNLVFLAEGEDLFTRGTGSSADSRLSMGAGGYSTSKTAFVTLPAGTYTLVLTNRCSGEKTGMHKFYKGSDEDPFFSADGNGYNAERTTDFTLTGTTTIYENGGDANNLIDWIYIYGTFADEADATCLIENPDMETAGSGSEYQEEVKGWSNCSVVTNYRRLANSGVTNPSGAFTNTYSFENWTDAVGGLVGQMSQTISGIPNGVYKLQLAALVNNVNGQFIYGKSNGKTYKTSIAGDANVANDFSVIVVVEDNQLEIGLDMNGSGATWVAIDNARLTYAPADATVPATVGLNGYTTFASTYPLDLTDANRPAGLKAYKATLTGSTLSFTKLNQTVPAGTGLLLLGETKGGTYNIPVAASGDAITTAFTGVTAATAKQSVADDTYYFVMKKASAADDPLAFAPLSISSEVTIPAGKAYITVLNSAFTGGARALDISFDDEETTGINAVNGEGLTVNGSFFDLQGRRVAQPIKGLYIVNGKKVVIK